MLLGTNVRPRNASQNFASLFQRFPAYRTHLPFPFLSSSLAALRFKRRTALRTELQNLRDFTATTIGAYDHRFRFRRRFFVGFSLFFVSLLPFFGSSCPEDSLFTPFSFFNPFYFRLWLLDSLIMAGCVVTEFLDFRINGFLISEFFIVKLSDFFFRSSATALFL